MGSARQKNLGYMAAPGGRNCEAWLRDRVSSFRRACECGEYKGRRTEQFDFVPESQAILDPIAAAYAQAFPALYANPNLMWDKGLVALPKP